MRKLLRHSGYARQLLLILAIPLALSGTGYALFSQKLSVQTNSSKPSYSSTQSVFFTYAKTETPVGTTTQYTLNSMTISNRGITSITAWRLSFSVPVDVTLFACDSTVTCTQSGQTITVVNKAANGTLAPGASTTFTASFTSSTSGYALQNIAVSGTVSTNYQNINGLTITINPRTVSKQGATYTYGYPFTVQNTSGQTVAAWQAVCSWSAIPTTSTISSTVSYTTNTSSITFTSKTSLTTNTSLDFTGTFTTKSASWVISNCTIQGKA